MWKATKLINKVEEKMVRVKISKSSYITYVTANATLRRLSHVLYTLDALLFTEVNGKECTENWALTYVLYFTLKYEVVQ